MCVRVWPPFLVKSSERLEAVVSSILKHVRQELGKKQASKRKQPSVLGAVPRPPQVHRQSNPGSDVHLSLSRTFYLLEPQINPFVNSLRASLHGFAG